MKAVQDNMIKKALSWEDKVNLCNDWKKTGMSKSEFARRNRLGISVFCKWCKDLWPDETKSPIKKAKENNNSDWVQINNKAESLTILPKTSSSAVEIKFPNGLVISMSI